MVVVLGPLCVSVDASYRDVDADSDGSGGEDEDQLEMETLERTTSASSNWSVVGADGFRAVGPAVIVGWSLACLGMGLREAPV